MTQTVHALYDGKVLKPEGPLDLKPNVRVRITIDDLEEKKTQKCSFLDTARSLKLEGPSDWSIRFVEGFRGRC